MTTIPRRQPISLVLPAVLLLLALLGAGCVGGIDDAAGGEGGDSSAVEEGGAPEPAAEVPAEGADRGDLSSRGAADADLAGGDDSTSVQTTAVRQRAIISTGTVTLREDDLQQGGAQVRKVIDANAGLIAERESDTDDEGDLTMARLVIRVPAGRFQALMDELGALSERPSITTASEDVTTQVIDVEARVRAQTASLERVEALLGRAEDLRDIVALESQLTRRQADLDSLKSQQAWLADQSSLSTVTVYLERREEKEEPADDDTGFLAGLSAGWSSLGKAASTGATILGALLPFAVLAALVGWPTWLLARRVVRRRGTAPLAPQPATAGPASPPAES